MLQAGAAGAAPRPAGRIAASCSSDPKQNGVEELSVRVTRVYEGKNPIVVYNQRPHLGSKKATLQGEDAYYPSTSTAAINDAGTCSHACIQNPDALPSNIPKTCTSYFRAFRQVW